MKYLKRFSNFILENKQQAKSILKKSKISEDDKSFVAIKNKLKAVFGRLTYLGLFTSYHYKQEITLDELFDLITWLKENSKKLPLNPLNYKKFEKLKDDIIKIDNDRRAKFIYNLLLSWQKDFIEFEKDEDFKSRAIEIQKIGLFSKFGDKLKAKKTRDVLISYMTQFIDSNSTSITFESIKKSINELNSRIVWVTEDESVLVAEIYDYATSNKVGSANWCISTAESNWNSYTKKLRRQFFLWDFNKYRTDPLFQIGFTTDEMGKVIHIHDKFDLSLSGDIPDIVLDTLENVDYKIDIDDLKSKILDAIKTREATIIYNENNILVVKVLNSLDFNALKQNDQYVSLNELEYTYLCYNFNNKTVTKDFYFSINAKNTHNNIYYDICDVQNNKKTIEFNLEKEEYKYGLFGFDIVDNFKNLLDTRDVSAIDDNFKKDVLDKLEPFVKGSDENEEIEYIPLGDGTTTGDLWLFKSIKITYRSTLANTIGSEYTWSRRPKIDKYNYYFLIDLNKDFYSKEFIIGVKISDNYSEVIYSENNKAIDILDNTLTSLVEKGKIIPKSSKEYDKELRNEKLKIVNEQIDIYNSDDSFDVKAKALYEFLENDDNLASSLNYFEKDLDYRNYFIIESYDYYELKHFNLYSEQILTDYGYSSVAYAIGTDNEVDEAAVEYIKNLLDDIGVPESLIQQNLKSGIGDEYADSVDYFYDMVREDPNQYEISKELGKKAEAQIQKAENIIEILKDEDDINKIKKVLEKNESDLFEFIQFAWSDIEYIDDSELEEWVSDNITSELETFIEDTVYDDDNYDYDEIEMDKKASQLRNEQIDEINSDPKDYFTNYFGYDENQINKMLKDYIDIDGVIEDIIQSDGRSCSLGSYDGREYEYEYNGETFYIYRTC